VLLTPDGKTVEAEARTAPDAPLREHQKGRETSTTRSRRSSPGRGGLNYRGQFDGTPDVCKFAQTLETVCVDTVESGSMTKDLALLIGPDQAWLTTGQFFQKIVDNMKQAMA